MKLDDHPHLHLHLQPHALPQSCIHNSIHDDDDNSDDNSDPTNKTKQTKKRYLPATATNPATPTATEEDNTATANDNDNTNNNTIILITTSALSGCMEQCDVYMLHRCCSVCFWYVLGSVSISNSLIHSVSVAKQSAGGEHEESKAE